VKKAACQQHVLVKISIKQRMVIKKGGAVFVVLHFFRVLGVGGARAPFAPPPTSTSDFTLLQGERHSQGIHYSARCDRLSYLSQENYNVLVL
jgi:hypothetical protein